MEEEEQRQKIMAFAKKQRLRSPDQSITRLEVPEPQPLLPLPMNLTLGALHLEALARKQRQMADSAATQAGGSIADPCCSSRGREADDRHGSRPPQSTGAVRCTILSYNIWFRTDVAVEDRMDGLAGIIADKNPDVLFFQEVRRPCTSWLWL